MKKYLGELLAPLVFLALGVFWLVKSYSIKLSSASVDLGGTPRTVPQIVSVLMIAVAVLLIAEIVIKAIKEGKADTAADSGEKSGVKNILKVVLVIVTSFLYCVFLKTLTFVPASVIAMLVVCLCFGIKKPLPLLLTSVGVPGLLFVVFRYLLMVPLP